MPYDAASLAHAHMLGKVGLENEKEGTRKGFEGSARSYEKGVC